MNIVSLISVLLILLFVGGMPNHSLAQDSLEAQLTSPTAQDILNQIEGRPVAKPDKEGLFRLSFEPEDTTLSDSHKTKIEHGILKAFPKEGRARLKIQSYATRRLDRKISARRVSLERALNIREFLKSQGISTQKIDLFPMGEQMPAPVSDHVTIHMTEE